jgi:hypothetical protein
MKSVTSVVAQAYRSDVWTEVKVSRAETRGGHIYLKFAERDACAERCRGAGPGQPLQRLGMCHFAYALQSHFQEEGAPALIRTALLRSLDHQKPAATHINDLAL